MKKAISLVLLIVLIGCAGPNQENTECINLGKQKIVVYETYTAKYSMIKFYYPLKLNDNQYICVYGTNGGTGYYYRKYSIKKGDTLEVPLSIFYDGDRIKAADIDLNAYEVK